MENVQVIPFRMSGDKNILLQEEGDLDIDSIDQCRAVVYSKPNTTDTVDNIDINVQLGSLGAFIYNITLDETFLRKIHTAINDKDTRNKVPLQKLRFLLRCLLLESEAVSGEYKDYLIKLKLSERSKDSKDFFYYDLLDVHNYVLESEMVILPNRQTYYKLFLNEKFQTTIDRNETENKAVGCTLPKQEASIFDFGSLQPGKLFGLNFNKRITEIRISEADTMHDSNGNIINLELNIEDYFYLINDIAVKRKLELLDLKSKQESQTKQINFYTNEVNNMRRRYESKIMGIEYAALKLVNSKKARLRKLVNLLARYQEIIDDAEIEVSDDILAEYNDEIQFINDEDDLHSEVEVTASSDSENEEENEEPDEEEDVDGEGGESGNGKEQKIAKGTKRRLKRAPTEKSKKKRKAFKDHPLKRRKETFREESPKSESEAEEDDDDDDDKYEQSGSKDINGHPEVAEKKGLYQAGRTLKGRVSDFEAKGEDTEVSADENSNDDEFEVFSQTDQPNTASTTISPVKSKPFSNKGSQFSTPTKKNPHLNVPSKLSSPSKIRPWSAKSSPRKTIKRENSSSASLSRVPFKAKYRSGSTPTKGDNNEGALTSFMEDYKYARQPRGRATKIESTSSSKGSHDGSTINSQDFDADMLQNQSTSDHCVDDNNNYPDDSELTKDEASKGEETDYDDDDDDDDDDAEEENSNE